MPRVAVTEVTLPAPCFRLYCAAKETVTVNVWDPVYLMFLRDRPKYSLTRTRFTLRQVDPLEAQADTSRITTSTL